MTYFGILPGLQFTSLCLPVDHASNHQNEVYFHVRRQTRPESWDVSSWPLRDDMKNSVTVYFFFILKFNFELLSKILFKSSG